jgi:peroxiredoxin
LRDREAEFLLRNVRTAIVTFESGFLAQAYAEDVSLPWPLLVDDTRETYRNYGMLTASFRDIWGPKTWWTYLKVIRKGAKLRTSHGDVYQRGGDVLIDPAGIVALHHIGKGPADRPQVEEILRRIDGR